jgi:ABC-2 type transport system permease protein
VSAILVNTAMQSALLSGVGLTTDLTNGVVSRFRAMPISMGSVLTARSITDLTRALVQLTLMIILAVVLFGFSPAGGVLGVLGGPWRSPWPSAGAWAGSSSP